MSLPMFSAKDYLIKGPGKHGEIPDFKGLAIGLVQKKLLPFQVLPGHPKDIGPSALFADFQKHSSQNIWEGHPWTL